MHRSQQRRPLEGVIVDKPWRIPAGEGGKQPTRTKNIGLEKIFKRLANPDTSEHEARGLIQSIVLAAGKDIQKRNEVGRGLRWTTVTCLMDIGYDPDPESGEMNGDLIELRRTARTTLARHVAPIIAKRSAYNNGDEHIRTLTELVRFYASLAELSAKQYFTEELSDRERKNVRDMLERVFLALRSEINAPERSTPTYGGTSAIMFMLTLHTALDDLTALFVRLRWWESLSRVRAVGAIPLLYEHEEVGDRTSPEFVPLQYEWEHVEKLRRAGTLSRRSTMEVQRDAILHDVTAILAASGGRFDPKEHEGRMQFSGIESLRGLFPLLHDLVATFMREVEFACPGVLSGDMPLPEYPTCLQHDECMNKAVRKGRTERAMQKGVQRTVYMMRFGDTAIHWMLMKYEDRNLPQDRIALVSNPDDTFSLVDTPERKRVHCQHLLKVLGARESLREPTGSIQPEQQADYERTATVYGREDAAFAHWTIICFASDISIAHYRAQVTAALDALK